MNDMEEIKRYDRLRVVESYLEFSIGDYFLIPFLVVISFLIMFDLKFSGYFFLGLFLLTITSVFGFYKFRKIRRFKKEAELLRVMES